MKSDRATIFQSASTGPGSSRGRLVSTVASSLGALLCALSLLTIASRGVFAARDVAAISKSTVVDEVSVDPTTVRREYVEPAYRELLGKIEIRRLGLEAPVRHGAGQSVLRSAVGHLPSTALPASSRGNVVLSAHRDSFFAPLKAVQAGDLIELSAALDHDRRVIRRFEVTGTSVVAEDDLSVLESSPEPELTLITCYPFYVVGPAPKRFVVRAREIQRDPVPTESASV